MGVLFYELPSPKLIMAAVVRHIARHTNPEKLEWKTLNDDNATSQSAIIWAKNSLPNGDSLRVKEYGIKSLSDNVFPVPSLERGFHYWAIKRTGCDNKWTISTPQIMYIFPALPEIKIPFWVKWILDFKNVFILIKGKGKNF